MKTLKKVAGPRDCKLVEVTIHIANLGFQIKQDRKIFEDRRQTHEARQEAHTRMVKAMELMNKWKEVRNEILQKQSLTANDVLNKHQKE